MIDLPKGENLDQTAVRYSALLIHRLPTQLLEDIGGSPRGTQKEVDEIISLFAFTYPQETSLYLAEVRKELSTVMDSLAYSRAYCEVGNPRLQAQMAANRAADQLTW